MARSAQLFGTCPVATGGGHVEQLPLLQCCRGKIWAPFGDIQSLLQTMGTEADAVSHLAVKVARKATKQEQQFLTTVQSMAATAAEAAAKLLPVARLAVQLEASGSALAAQCISCSLKLQLRAADTPAVVPRCLPRSVAFPEDLLRTLHYGIASTEEGAAQLQEGTAFATELELLGHHLCEPAAILNRTRQCRAATRETRLSRILELAGFAVLTGSCKPHQASVLLYLDGHLVTRFFGFLRARGAAASTLELHTKSALAVVHFLQSVALGADQDSLTRLEQWFQELRQGFAQESATRTPSLHDLPHPGLLIHHVTSRVEDTLRAAAAGELQGRRAKQAQAALFLGLLGFAYGPPLRANAVRELQLLPLAQLAELMAKLAQLRTDHAELLRQQESRTSCQGREEQQLQGQAAADIFAQAASLKTCTNADCTDPFCLGNRVQVVGRGASRVVQFRLVHHKTEESHGEQVVVHEEPAFQHLACWWIDHGHDELAPGCQALFFNDRGQPFPSSRSLSVYLKAACWDIPGCDICARSARGLYVTAVRDYLGDCPEAILAAERGLAAMMMTSISKWTSNYDARSRADRERRLARHAHARFRAAMLAEWEGPAGSGSRAKLILPLQQQQMLLCMVAVAALGAVLSLAAAGRLWV